MEHLPNQALTNHEVVVVALSSFKGRFVPLSEAVIYSLFPDPVIRRGKKTTLARRLASLRLSVNAEGKIGSRCSKWWDTDELSALRESNPQSVAQPWRAYNLLTNASQRGFVSPFGADLPVFIDTKTSVARSLCWHTLERDVLLGINGEVPFKYHIPDEVSDADRQQFLEQIPFLDIEHHMSLIPGELMLSLIRQLIKQHSRTEGSMDLIPARWLEKIYPDDSIVVEVGVSWVTPITDPTQCFVRVGAVDAWLRRTDSVRFKKQRNNKKK